MGNKAEFQKLVIQTGKPDHPVLKLTGTVIPAELFRKAATLFHAGRLDEAIACLRMGLATRPDWAEAHNNLGILFIEQGKPDEAIASFRRALSIKPDYAEAYNNLGNAFKDQGKPDAATELYRKAFAIKPDYAEAYNNLGNTLMDQGKLDEAAIYYREVLKLKPNSAETYSSLGAVCRDRGKLDEAAINYREALKLKPDSSETYGNLGGVLLRQGKLQDALECFQRQIRLDPENGGAQHLIASLTGRTSERPPTRYVESLFDSCADKFDTHLQQVLKYDIPEKLASLIAQHSAAPAAKWNILDLGCGTGLVGLSVAPYARQLVGVDLSARMLEQAGARNLYHRLEHLDLLTMMQKEKTASYDLIIAADVFVYLGKLDEIVCEAKRLLCTGGLFAFSVESLEAALIEDAGTTGYQLGLTGRYMHSSGYLTGLAAAHGYLVVELAETQVRLDQGKPVIGYIVVLQNTAKLPVSE